MVGGADLHGDLVHAFAMGLAGVSKAGFHGVEQAEDDGGVVGDILRVPRPVGPELGTAGGGAVGPGGGLLGLEQVAMGEDSVAGGGFDVSCSP